MNWSFLRIVSFRYILSVTFLLTQTSSAGLLSCFLSVRDKVMTRFISPRLLDQARLIKDGFQVVRKSKHRVPGEEQLLPYFLKLSPVGWLGINRQVDGLRPTFIRTKDAEKKIITLDHEKYPSIEIMKILETLSLDIEKRLQKIDPHLRLSNAVIRWQADGFRMYSEAANTKAIAKDDVHSFHVDPGSVHVGLTVEGVTSEFLFKETGQTDISTVGEAVAFVGRDQGLIEALGWHRALQELDPKGRLFIRWSFEYVQP